MPNDSNKGDSLQLRRHVRFRANPLDVGYIQIEPIEPGGTRKPFGPNLVAYIENESPYGGCALILHDTAALEVGKQFCVQLGPLSPLMATLVYKDNLTESLVRAGFKFLE